MRSLGLCQSPGLDPRSIHSNAQVLFEDFTGLKFKKLWCIHINSVYLSTGHWVTLADFMKECIVLAHHRVFPLVLAFSSHHSLSVSLRATRAQSFSGASWEQRSGAAAFDSGLQIMLVGTASLPFTPLRMPFTPYWENWAPN